ncbi:MAG: DUF4238 domain-containing protein [Micavibrio sp.]|nr:DUF4238 domain-containing protein [Micavibrio sp.]
MAKQQVTKRQHHFPQMMLKRFTNENHQIFMYDCVANKLSEPRSTETVAFQNHLYSVHYETHKDDALEKKFSKIESEAEDVVNRVLSIETNTPRDAQSLLEFVTVLISRTPQNTRIAETKGSSNDMRAILEDKGRKKTLPEEAIKKYADSMQSNKGFSFASTFNTLFEDLFFKLVENFNPLLCFARAGHFIVSDNYATFEPVEQIDPYRTDWWTMQIRIHCPIASNACLTFIPKDDPAKIGTLDLNWAKLNISETRVSEINLLTAKQKDRYLYSGYQDELRKYITHTSCDEAQIQ